MGEMYLIKDYTVVESGIMGGDRLMLWYKMYLMAKNMHFVRKKNNNSK